MPTEPAVSVVVRTKNRSHLLRRAIEDVCAQTFGDIQLIVVNDGGDADDVARVIDRIDHSMETPIEVVHHSESRGRWAAANAGVRLARGRYIAMHDDDDFWDPEFLARTTQYLDARPQAVAVTVAVEIVEESLSGDGSVKERARRPFGGAADVTMTEMFRHNHVVPIALLYRRSLHEELGMFDESLPVVGDWEFLLRVIARYPLARLSGPPLAFWSQRFDNSDNSVIAEAADHRRFDETVRDRAIRESIAQNGQGLPLLIVGESRHLENRVVHVLSERLAELRDEVAQLRDTVERLSHDEHTHRSRPRWRRILG